MSKHTTLEQLRKLAVRTKSELDAISSVASGAIRSGDLVNHVARFWTSTDKSGTPAFTMDIPEEMFLDQAATVFVDNFTWSAATYPGSTEPNPSLDGKPVFVLAIKGEDATANPSYSFINMQALVDTYSPAAGDGSATVSINGYNIGVNVNLSTDAGNILTKDVNGKLYAAHQDISGKADKDTDAVEGNFAAFDANGNPVDSGHKHSDYLTAHQDITGKADKVASPTSGDLAGLDSNGNLTDSGIAAADVQQKLAANAFTSGNIRTSNAQGFAQDGGIAAADLQQKLAANAFTQGNVRVTDANGFAQDGGVLLSSLLVGTAATDTEVDDMLDEVFGSSND